MTENIKEPTVRLSSQSIHVESDKGSVALYMQTRRGFQPVGRLCTGSYHAEHGSFVKELRAVAESNINKNIELEQRIKALNQLLAKKDDAIHALKRRVEIAMSGMVSALTFDANLVSFPYSNVSEYLNVLEQRAAAPID